MADQKRLPTRVLIVDDEADIAMPIECNSVAADQQLSLGLGISASEFKQATQHRRLFDTRKQKDVA